MKKRIIKGFFALIVTTCLCLSCGLVVFAHPGGTDEYGGHYDQETGDYHYHHGYPPHSHTNGTCPYDFDDKTGWNSGSSSGSTVQTTTNPSVTTTKPQSATVSTTGPVWDPYLRPDRQSTTTSEQTEDKNDPGTYVLIVILLIICVIPIVAFVLIYNYLFKSDIVYTQNKKTTELKAEKIKNKKSKAQQATAKRQEIKSVFRKKADSFKQFFKENSIKDIAISIAALIAIAAVVILPPLFNVLSDYKEADNSNSNTKTEEDPVYVQSAYDEDRALEEGYDIGYDEGRLDGYEIGYGHGLEDGFEDGLDILGDEVCYRLEDLELYLKLIKPDNEEESSALLEIEELISDIYDECGW